MQSGGKYASKMRAAIYSALPYPYDRDVSVSAIYHGKLKAAASCAFSAAFNFFLPFPTPTNAAVRTYAPAVRFAPQNARKRGGFAPQPLRSASAAARARTLPFHSDTSNSHAFPAPFFKKDL